MALLPYASIKCLTFLQFMEKTSIRTGELSRLHPYFWRWLARPNFNHLTRRPHPSNSALGNTPSRAIVFMRLPR